MASIDHTNSTDRDKRFLVVMADDFGMHPAINDGIVRAFIDGILTDANVLSCCPAVEEALNSAREQAIPIGAHIAFTSEWDSYRWGPITRMASMVDSENHFYPTVELAWSNPDALEVRAEVISQLDRLGADITHIGEHMGSDKGGLLANILAEISVSRKVPHKGQWGSYERHPCLHYVFTSTFSTSGRANSVNEVKSWLRHKLATLEPGYHLWVCHPGANSPSLDQMCTVTWPARRWAREIRGLDLSVLLDKEVLDWLAQYDVTPVPIRTVPVAISGVSKCQS